MEHLLLGLLQEDEGVVVAAWVLENLGTCFPITFAHRQVPNCLIKFHGREKGVQLWSKFYYFGVIGISLLSLRASDSPVAVGACILPQFSGCFHGIELGVMTGGFTQRGWELKREGGMDGFAGNFGANFVSIVVCCSCSN
jgi:hypothetical protein